jgi:dTDP-glucose 4,6-dehydratase
MIHKNILVTGGCGFIGSNFLMFMTNKYPNINFYNYDKLSYCSDISGISKLVKENYTFIKGDINDSSLLINTLNKYNIDVVVHFAAQTHVDNSFLNPNEFIDDNIKGTYTLINCCKNYNKLKKFIHMSTDEVYGDIHDDSQSYETDRLNPTNPYSATKASAEMLINSYLYCYNFPAVIIRCNNVYGNYQHHEKVIPRFIRLLIENKKMTIQGNGKNLRTFINVLDVARAIDVIIQNGILKEIYNIGSTNEYDIYSLSVLLLNIMKPNEKIDDWIEYINDRLYNDYRYVVNYDKLKMLGWREEEDFVESIKKIIDNYIYKLI